MEEENERDREREKEAKGEGAQEGKWVRSQVGKRPHMIFHNAFKREEVMGSNHYPAGYSMLLFMTQLLFVLCIDFLNKILFGKGCLQV